MFGLVHIFGYLRIHTLTKTHTHTLMLYIHVRMYIYIHIYTCICMYVCKCMFIESVCHIHMGIRAAMDRLELGAWGTMQFRPSLSPQEVRLLRNVETILPTVFKVYRESSAQGCPTKRLTPVLVFMHSPFRFSIISSQLVQRGLIQVLVERST